MKKLRLDLDRLQIESFATADAQSGRGTVDAHISLRCTGGTATCGDGNTCGGVGYTCDLNTCYISCLGSCPCEPDYGTYDCTGGIQTAGYTCSPCNVSANEVGTCVAPCTRTC